MRRLFAPLLALCLAALPARACETALLLAVDVSNSIDPGEYRIQIDGTAAALLDAQVRESIVLGSAAIAVMQWSGQGMQEMSIPWTRLRTDAEIEVFAERVRRLRRAHIGGNTALGEALQMARRQFGPVADCTRKVVDVSGDGSENAETDVGAARRAAQAAGIEINGLAIEGLGRAITTYYERNVITRDGFVVTARGHTDYARAIREKLRRELSKVMF